MGKSVSYVIGINMLGMAARLCGVLVLVRWRLDAIGTAAARSAEVARESAATAMPLALAAADLRFHVVSGAAMADRHLGHARDRWSRRRVAARHPARRHHSSRLTITRWPSTTTSTFVGWPSRLCCTT